MRKPTHTARPPSARVRARRAATATTLALVAPGMALLLAGPAAAADVAVERVPGQTRYDTAAATAAEAFGTADTVVLVNGDAFPDAMSAAYLAGLNDAPILLTRSDATPAATSRALRALQARKVIVVGGSRAVSPVQAASLTRAGLSVSRVAGADRYATAAAVARAGGASPIHVGTDGRRTALLASGTSFADAMAAAPLSYARHLPVLFTGASLPDLTRSSLRDLDIDSVIVLGGSHAVSPSVVQQVDALAGVSVRRIAGADRQATAVALAGLATGELGFGSTTVGLASGASFADGLAAGPLLGRAGAPLLLTAGPADLGRETRRYLSENGADLTTAKVFGGTTAVAPAVLTVVRDAITAPPAPAPPTPPAETPAGPAPDRTPPAPAVLDSAGHVLHAGLAHPDVTLQGTAETGATVRLHRAEEPVGPPLLTDTATDGRFRFSLEGLPEGTHTYVVTVTDAAGNTSTASAVQTVLVDLTAPGAVRSLQQDVAGPTNADTLTVTGFADADSTVLVLDATGTVVGSTGPVSDDPFRVEVDLRRLPSGTPTTLHVVAHDVVGNRTPPRDLTPVTPDRDAPDAPVVSSQSPQGLTAARVLHLAGTAEAGSTVLLRDGDDVRTSTTALDGTWSLSTGLPLDAVSTWEVVTRDEAGNLSPATALVPVEQDATPPAMPVADVRTLLTRDAVVVTGTADEGTSVELFVSGRGQVATAQVTDAGTFRFELSSLELHLAEGPYGLVLLGRDAAGNHSSTSDEVALTVDRTAPALVPSVTRTGETTFTVAGPAEAGSRVEVALGDVRLAGPQVVGAGGTFSLPVDLGADIGEGSYTLTVTATDPAGNVARNTSQSVVVDRSAVPIAELAQDPLTSDGTFAVRGRAEARSVVVVRTAGGEELARETADGQGVFDLAVSTSDLAPGAHVLTIEHTDSAGNTSTPQQLQPVTVVANGEVTLLDATFVDGADDLEEERYSPDDVLHLSLLPGGSVVDGTTSAVFDLDGDVGTEGDQEVFVLHHGQAPSTETRPYVLYSVTDTGLALTWGGAAGFPSASPGTQHVSLLHARDAQQRTDPQTGWAAVTAASVAPVGVLQVDEAQPGSFRNGDSFTLTFSGTVTVDQTARLRLHVAGTGYRPLSSSEMLLEPSGSTLKVTLVDTAIPVTTAEGFQVRVEQGVYVHGMPVNTSLAQLPAITYRGATLGAPQSVVASAPLYGTSEVSGTAEAGTVVRVWDQLGAEIGGGWSEADGRFSFLIEPASPGTTLYVTQETPSTVPGVAARVVVPAELSP